MCRAMSTLEKVGILSLIKYHQFCSSELHLAYCYDLGIIIFFELVKSMSLVLVVL